MTPDQRTLRLCVACRLPAWFLPVDVLRYATTTPGNGQQPVIVKPAHGKLPRVLKFNGSWRVALDGTIMQTIFSFLDSSALRDNLLFLHPHIRHCFPIPGIRFENSVAAVYPGVVAAGDAPFSGYFPKSRPAVAAVEDPAKEPAKLGAGGFGQVYQAYDQRYKSLVAVKLISKDFRSTPYKYDRTFATLLREVEVHRKLSDHVQGGLRSHIAPLVDVFQTRGNLVMVVNACQGRTLRSAAREVRDADSGANVPLPVPDIVVLALRALQDVCKALKFMDSCNYVHRDIKLDNIVVSRDYQKAHIIDFGLSSELRGDGAGMFPALGTASYMSPENLDCLVRRARAFHATRRTILAADVFSLGVALHIMLANKRVYDSPKDFRSNLLKARYGFPCEGGDWDRVPKPVRELVRSMLSFDPQARPTFDEIINHPVMSAPWFDVDGFLQRRRERLKREDEEMQAKWDFCLDAYDADENDNDDEDLQPPAAPVAAKGNKPSASTATTSSPQGNQTSVLHEPTRTKSAYTYVDPLRDKADDSDEVISSA